MNPLREFENFSAKHPVLVDALTGIFVVVVFSPVYVIAYQSGPYSGYLFPFLVDAPWISSTIIVLSVIAQIAFWSIRRPYPVTSAVATVIIHVIYALFTTPLAYPAFFVPMTIFNLAKNGPRWASLAGLWTGIAGSVIASVTVGVLPKYLLTYDDIHTVVRDPEPIVTIFIFLLCIAIVLASWAFGYLGRTRRLVLSRLEERNRALEVEAAQERALAAADERNRIAREMHDIIAHSLQVIISQADGGRYAGAAKPELALESLNTIAGTSREALTEMRQLLGVLRGADSDAHDSPMPGLEDLEELVRTAEMSGLQVSLEIQDEPRHPLPPGAELVAYRVVQEALTNTAKHAGLSSTATVLLRWTNRGLVIRVEDTGPHKANPSYRELDLPAGGGQGLIGMQERLDLYEGTLAYGTRSAGGFLVHAFIPYQQN